MINHPDHPFSKYHGDSGFANWFSAHTFPSAMVMNSIPELPRSIMWWCLCWWWCRYWTV